MKKIIWSIIGLIVLGVIGAVIYVTSIDWNEHKDKLATQFYEMTGKKVVFNGPVSLKLLPYPSLSAENVRILNPYDMKAKPLVEVKKLVAELASRPLLSGVFEVERMTLENPQVYVELLENGLLNWQGKEGAEKPKAEISLNSVELRGAKVVYEDMSRNLNIVLDDLSGEVVAQSLYGPYRIEGNYLKDGVPQGFAVSVGTLSDTMATSLNLVFTHPMSKSYVRFDGTFMFKNKVLNGNTIFESGNLQGFWKANWPEVKFDQAYDYPLALTFDTAFNPRQLNLSNIVVKYGESQGAGTMQVPLHDGVFATEQNGIKPRVNLAFNFTDFTLDPLVYTFNKYLTSYRGDGLYKPNLPFDVLADIKSVRTQYNGQAVKNFETSFDIINNIVTINNLSAVLPGDSSVKLSGSVSSYEDKPFYTLDASFKSQDFLKTLNWMKIEPVISAASTYKRASGSAKLSGTLEKIQISPFELTVDKTELSGEAGLKLKDRLDAMLILNADSVNFDNYISALPVEEANKSWSERIKYRFSKLGVLKDFDAQIKTRVNLGIYSGLPFEQINFEAVLLNGKMDVQDLKVASIANAAVELKGEVSGFGALPQVENLNYNIETDNLSAFIEKLGLDVWALDCEKMSQLKAIGAVSGSFDSYSLNSQTQLNNLETQFRGQVEYNENASRFNGELELKHPDFSKMLEMFASPYKPSGQSMGLVSLKSRVNGTQKAFRVEVEEANIGYNTFKGKIDFEKQENRPHLVADLAMNKFEVERFLNQSSQKGNRLSIPSGGPEKAEFLAQPNWDKNKIDYAFYQTFDLSGSFKVQDLSYYSKHLQDASFSLALLQGNLDVSDLKGKANQGQLNIGASLKMGDNPTLDVQAVLENMDVTDLGWNGSVYGFNKGVMNSDFTVSGNASSEYDWVKSLKGQGKFTLSDVNFKGWNLAANLLDIKERENAEGLNATIKGNLSQGASVFNTFNGNITFDKGQYTLTDTVMSGNGAEVKVFGGGSFDPWDMDLRFDVKYDDIKYIPGYTFTFKGAANAPILDVNTDALFNLYKNRQEKIDNDARIAREAEENRIKALIEEQKNIANNLVAEIRREIDSNIDAKSQNIYSQDAQYKYDSLRRRAGEVAAALVEAASSGNEGRTGEDVVAELKQVNQNGMAELETMKEELKQVYMDDIRSSISALYTQIVAEVNKSKQIVFQYNVAKDGFESRLKNIVTTYLLAEDVNIRGWDSFMREKESGFSEMSLKLLDDKDRMLASDSEVDVVAYNKECSDILDNLKVDLISMEETIAEMSKYAEEKVKEQEEAYSNKLREEEVKRKVEENTGSISVKKTGRTVEVSRNIEEIEKVEEMVEEHEVRVLDFSKPKAKTAAPESRSSSGVVRKGWVKVN